MKKIIIEHISQTRVPPSPFPLPRGERVGERVTSGVLKWISVLISLMIGAVEAQAITLDEVVDEVIKNHPAIESAKWDAQSAKAEKTAESWLMDPMIGVEFEQIPVGGGIVRDAEMINYSVSQEIPFPGSLIARHTALKAKMKAKLSMLTEMQREKVFEAQKTFFELVTAQNQLREKKAVLSYYRQLSALLEKNYETGGRSRSQAPTMQGQTSMTQESPLSDLLMAKMKKAETEAEIYDLDHQREAATAKLNLMMKREAHLPITITKTPQIKKLSVDDKILEAKLEKQNGVLQTMEWMTKMAKSEVSVARQKLIPSLMPEFMYNQRKGMEDAYTLGLNLNFPLWLGRNEAEIRMSKADYLKAKSDYETGVVTAKTDLHNLYHHAVEHRKIVLKYQGEIVPYARTAAKSALTSYESGGGDSTSTLQKLMGYHEAVGMYWDMWKDYQIEYAMLEQLVGEKL